MNLQTFHHLSQHCSKLTTQKYSTSFASAIRLLHPDLREPVYNIYGFVRFADEIVDSFHDFDKKQMLDEFKSETFMSINRGISLNPILNSFQLTVNQYQISKELILSFFKSMEMDLHNRTYDEQGYNEYIYGSAEVVGLMCLHVFCDGNSEQFVKLQSPARALGAAFQKVNFLRDINADFHGLSRTYFPGVDFRSFDPQMKLRIEEDIEKDFDQAFEGLMSLPWKARFGVYVAYKYYWCLFTRIQQVQASRILKQRIRIPDYVKTMIVMRAKLKNQLNLI